MTPTAGAKSTAQPVNLAAPLSAVAGGRVGDAEYVVGSAGPDAVDWFSPNGEKWAAPEPLDATPQLGIEQPRGSCGAGNSAVVVGSVITTDRGREPAAWVSGDGSSWTSATFVPAPPPGSFTTLDGCLSTGNGFIAYGESTGNGQGQQPVLWSSADGTTWQQLPTTFTDVTGSALSGSAGDVQAAPLDDIALGTTTWLGLSGEDDSASQVWPAPVGGWAGAFFIPAGLWSSIDAGNSWQQVSTASTPFSGAVYAQVDAALYLGQQPIVAGTIDGHLAVWVGTASSPAPGGAAGTTTG